MVNDAPKPMAANEVEIVSTRQAYTVDLSRLGKMDLLVTYKTASGEVALVTVPAETANESTIKAAIAAQRKAAGQWQGKRLAL